VTKARKAIAGFKIRQGYPIGAMVTLRGERMWEFLDRFVTVALPRVRDFRGVSGKSFDGRGNYNIGVKEQIIFPEIEYDKIDALRPGITFTYLGLKVDDKAAVHFGGKPSANLFVAGEMMAGNVLGKGYTAGVGMSIGTAFGRIAGTQAARAAAAQRGAAARASTESLELQHATS